MRTGAGVKPAVQAFLGDVLFRLTGLARRRRVIGAEQVAAAHAAAPGVIFSVWHGRLLLGAHARRGRGTAVLISQHADGEIIARIVARHGYRPVRGSTTRGGARALEELVELAGSGVREIAITPDGPRGPRHVAAPGVIEVARRTRFVIVPASASARPASFIGSWDRFMVPWPLSDVVVVYGPPIAVPADPGPGEAERLRLAVEQAMIAVEEEADSRVGWTG